MKKIIVISVIVIIGGIIGYFYYNGQIITTYLRVSVYPPTSYDSRPKVEIQQTPQYESDSLAFDTEMRVYRYMQEQWEDERKVSEKKSHYGDEAVYRRFRDEQRSIIKLVHKRSFDMKQFRELIFEGGPNSNAVEKYCRDNDVNLSVYPLFSKY